MSIGRSIAIGGLLTTIAVLFQSAPLFFPMLGMAFSPFSTLPIAMAAVMSVSLGFKVFFSTIFILTIFSVEEALIFCFTTGLLGVVMGTILYRKGIIASILLSSIALSLGMICLTYIVQLAAFVEFISSFSGYLIFLIFFGFSIVYTSIWNTCFRKFMSDLTKIIRCKDG